MDVRTAVTAVAIGFLFAATPLHGQCDATCSVIAPDGGTAGEGVSFRSTAAPCNCAESPSYLWTFGDGETSTLPNPMHVYAAHGTYEWRLVVAADGDGICSKSGSIIINAGGVVPKPGKFTGTTSQGLAFELTVDDEHQISMRKFGFVDVCGATGSSSATYFTPCTVSNGNFTCSTASCILLRVSSGITGTFTSPTTVSGTATVTNWPSGGSCCTITPSFSASASPLSVSASADPPSGISPLLVNFTATPSGGTPPYWYEWDFGDCSDESKSQNPSHQYAAGHWNAVLTVTDLVNATAQTVVPVGALAGDASSLELSAPPTAVVGNPFTVTVTTRDPIGNVAIGYDGQVAFSSSDGAASLPGNYTFTGSDAGVQTFTDAVTLTTPGTRTLAVTDAADGALTDSVQIKVGHLTSTSLTSSPNPTEQNATVTLTATVTSGFAGSITGTVTFREGMTVLGSSSLSDGSASLQTSSLAGGPHSITARYAGNATYLASTSRVHTHYVLLSAPAVDASAPDSASVIVSMSEVSGATLYQLFRSSDNSTFSPLGTTRSMTFIDTAVWPDTTYFYRVRVRDAGNNWGATSASDPATTTTFTDNPLVDGSTTVKSEHVSQLRTAVNAMRAAAGLAAATFTDPTLTSATGVKAVHIAELRNALAAARTALGLGALTFTDPALTAGTTRVKAVHVTQLRTGVN